METMDQDDADASDEQVAMEDSPDGATGTDPKQEDEGNEGGETASRTRDKRNVTDEISLLPYEAKEGDIVRL